MDHLVSFLRSTPLFSDCSEEVLLRKVLPCGHCQEYRKGQFVIVPQQCVSRFGIVLRGKIHILHIFEDGSQSLMSSIREGGAVGADLICTRSRLSPYYAAAATDAQLLYLPADLLLRTDILSDADRGCLLQRMLYLISRENMKKEYRLAILSQKGLRERIMTYLTMQADRLDRQSFTIPFTREEMASYLCVNRSALSHELSKMEQEGLLTFRKNRFTLHPPKTD